MKVPVGIIAVTFICDYIRSEDATWLHADGTTEVSGMASSGQGEAPPEECNTHAHNTNIWSYWEYRLSLDCLLISPASEVA